MRMLRVKNWAEFQHYKDRNPPWIKLHRSLLDDYEFSRLQDASKAHLMLIWLFASQNDGRIPEDAKFLQRKLGLERPPDLKTLISQRLLIPEQDASTVIADSKQDASDSLSLARSQEERREEESNARFAVFWEAYPRKVDKQEARKTWDKLRITNGDFDAVMAGLSRWRACEQWKNENGRFIPHPSTWLNKRRFDDEVESSPPKRVAL